MEDDDDDDDYVTIHIFAETSLAIFRNVLEFRRNVLVFFRRNGSPPKRPVTVEIKRSKSKSKTKSALGLNEFVNQQNGCNYAACKIDKSSKVTVELTFLPDRLIVYVYKDSIYNTRRKAQRA